MAEIHVQVKKKTPAWIWIIVGVIVIAAIIFMIIRSSQAKQNNSTQQAPATSEALLTHPHELISYS